MLPPEGVKILLVLILASPLRTWLVVVAVSAVSLGAMRFGSSSSPSSIYRYGIHSG